MPTRISSNHNAKERTLRNPHTAANTEVEIINSSIVIWESLFPAELGERQTRDSEKKAITLRKHLPSQGKQHHDSAESLIDIRYYNER